MRKEYVLENAKARAVVTIEDGRVKEEYYALEGGEATLLAENWQDSSFGGCLTCLENHEGPGTSPSYPDEPVALFDGSPDEYTTTPKLAVGEPAPKLTFSVLTHELVAREGSQTLYLTGESSEGEVLERRIVLADDDSFEITNTMTLKRCVELEYFADYYAFAPGHEPDFTWTPHLKYDPSGLSPDWTFKSPSVMIQKASSALAIVPDLDFLSHDPSIQLCTAGLDLDITQERAPRAGYGLIPSEPHYHSMFIHPIGLKNTIPEGSISYKYYLFVNARTPERQIYRRIAGFLWDRFGRKNFLAGHQAQAKSFNVLEKEAWHWIGRKFWIEFDYQGKHYGGFRDYHRELEDDIWYFGWWNSLRTAYGMELYARRRKHPETSRKARAIFDLIADAPRKDGVFPAVFVKLDGERRWTAGSPSGFGGPIEDYHTFTMSWTAYWLLKWKLDLDPEDERVMPICTEYADFLVRNQRDTGFIPSYYREADLAVDENMRMNRENAEPAVCALFLIAMFQATRNPAYLETAEKAIRYVQREIMPENKWFDYETFYSCSPKDYGFYDQITGQHPQCNMALIMMAQACLDLHRVEGGHEYLELGKQVLDYLCLFQQVWSHPRMEPNLIGGFATQNTDGEWSDSRQSYCAMVLMDYYEETRDRVYFERGVAAMRATLAISPYENWSHRGYNNEPGFFSSFHWGIGTGLTTEEMLLERYGDVFVNLAEGYAYGLNGCTVTDYRADSGEVNLTIESDIRHVTPLTLFFRGEVEGSVRVVVNGVTLGEHDSASLARGVEWYFVKPSE